MSIYLIPIKAAILTFPILAAMITIPYILVQYRKYGSIHPVRVGIIYSFIFYLLCAYFLVMLPLPPIEEVAHYTTPFLQLVPFNCLVEFSVSSSFILNDPSTYLTALNEPSLFLIIFNIALVIPFGMYLRYYFECSWKKTFLFSFLLSLSFECLQLSALFGIYPRPYRLFDVDDLIMNTIGGMIGYAITPMISRFLPSRSKLDETSIEKGKQVSSLRRISAFFIDVFLVSIVSAITLLILYLTNIIRASTLSYDILYIYTFNVCVFIIAMSLVFKGKTLGKAIVKIRLVKGEHEFSTWYQQILHYGFLYLIIIPMPYLIFLNVVDYFDASTSNFSGTLFVIVFMVIFYSISLTQCIRCLFAKNYKIWYDRKWNLHNISTIPYLVQESESEILDESVEETSQ